MGLYINPRDGSTKEQFLHKYGTRMVTPKMPVLPEVVLVCLIDNRVFTAAAVMFSDKEFEEFSDPEDNRPRSWFFVPKALLPSVCDGSLKHYFPEFATSS